MIVRWIALCLRIGTVTSLAIIAQMGCGPKVETAVSNATNAEARTTHREYYAEGKLKSEFTYVDGRRKGPFTTWYANGQKASTGTLLKSIPYDDVSGAFENTYEGLCLEWYEDGKPKRRANYSNGKLHGRYEYWDNSDKGYWKRYDENYKDGKQHGVCIRWDTGIKIVSEYKDGNIHGRVRGYADPGGQLKYEHWYKNGRASGPFDLKEEKPTLGASSSNHAQPMGQRP